MAEYKAWKDSYMGHPTFNIKAEMVVKGRPKTVTLGFGREKAQAIMANLGMVAEIAGVVLPPEVVAVVQRAAQAQVEQDKVEDQKRFASRTATRTYTATPVNTVGNTFSPAPTVEYRPSETITAADLGF